MAGEFYTLQEVEQKIGKTEEQIRQLVKDGKLREFRDGPNLLFKIEEVDTLAGDSVRLDGSSMGFSLEIAGGSESGEISLLPDESEAGLSQDDTHAGTQGINVLGETDIDFNLTADKSAETRALEEEKPGGRLDEDVNLDSFGSGSGLLDLSLQADDTSLGAVLDDLQAASPAAAAAEPQEAAVEPQPEDSAAASDAESILLAEVETGSTASAAFLEPSLAAVYFEPQPDAQSNTIGIMMLVPMLFLIYATIVAMAGAIDIEPALLTTVQGFIWFAIAGAAAIIVVLALVSALAGKKR